MLTGYGEFKPERVWRGMWGGGQVERWDLAELFEGRLHLVAGDVTLVATSGHDWGSSRGSEGRSSAAVHS